MPPQGTRCCPADTGSAAPGRPSMPHNLELDAGVYMIVDAASHLTQRVPSHTAWHAGFVLTQSRDLFRNSMTCTDVRKCHCASIAGCNVLQPSRNDCLSSVLWCLSPCHMLACPAQHGAHVNICVIALLIMQYTDLSIWTDMHACISLNCECPPAQNMQMLL